MRRELACATLSVLIGSVFALAAQACGRDVLVGENPADLTPLTDGGGADGVSPEGDALADASSDAEAGALESALAAVAVLSGELIVAGHEGGPTGTEATSNVWLGRRRVDASERIGGPIDLQGGADSARAVLSIGATDWIAAGLATTPAGRRAWARRMTTGDAEVWTKLVDPSAAAGASDSEATSLAAGSAATIVIAGIESGPANPGDGWVARLDAAGAVVWRQSLRGGAAQDTLLATVAVNDLDQVFVAGRRRVALDGGVGLVPAIVKLSPAGVLSGSQASFGGPLREGSLRSVLTEPFQEVTVCLDSGGNVVVARLDVSFVVIGRQELTDPRGAIELGGCVGTSDGAILVVGTIGTATGPLAWSAKLDRSPLAIQWQRAIPTTGPARAVAVAADGAGGGWAVGSTPAPLRRWAATIAP